MSIFAELDGKLVKYVSSSHVTTLGVRTKAGQVRWTVYGFTGRHGKALYACAATRDEAQAIARRVLEKGLDRK